MLLSSLEKSPRVLVADDDRAIGQLLATIIHREGLDVDRAEDGKEALDLLQQHSYAVILLDLMMPRVSGFDVIEYLKEHPPALKPIVLVVTAYSDQKFKSVDSDIVAGVIRKPFEVAEIGSLIRLCVRGFDEEITAMLRISGDPTVRELARFGSKDDESENGEAAN